MDIKVLWFICATRKVKNIQVLRIKLGTSCSKGNLSTNWATQTASNYLIWIRTMLVTHFWPKIWCSVYVFSATHFCPISCLVMLLNSCTMTKFRNLVFPFKAYFVYYTFEDICSYLVPVWWSSCPYSFLLILDIKEW